MHVPVFFLCNVLVNHVKYKVPRESRVIITGFFFPLESISLIWSPSIADERLQHFGECSEPTAFEPGGVVIVPCFDTGLWLLGLI